MRHPQSSTLFKIPFKERAHSEMETCERLDYCLHIRLITLIFPKLQMCSYYPRQCVRLYNLHIQGPVSQHSRTCITQSMDLLQNLQGPASDHPDLHKPSRDLHHTIRTCIRTSKDLHQNIRTCINHLGTCITPSGPASHNSYLHRFIVIFPAG